MRDYLITVQALIAKAEDPAATEAEREALLGKACEFMVKQGITDAMIGNAKPVPDVIVSVRKIFDPPYAISKASLYRVISKSFRCATVYLGARTRTYHVFGYQSDVDKSEVLYTMLLLHGNTMLSRQRVQPGQNMKSFITSYWYGYADEIGRRLSSASKVAESESEPGSAVVLYDRSKAVKDAMSAKYPLLTTVVRHYGSRAGYNAGKAEGAKANLNQSANVGGRNAQAIGR